jgi:hypothetical protein
MTDEIPDGLPQLRDYLLKEFNGIVPPATNGTKEQRESNFLTRALAAYAIHKLAGCSKEDAAKSVVDGGGDGGIDAIYFARQTNGTLWVIQSKYIATGRGEPDGLEKFRNGLEAVLTADLSFFSESNAWQSRIPEINAILNTSEPIQVRAAFVYSSIQPINATRLGQFDKLEAEFSRGSDYFFHNSYNLSSIFDWLTGADQPIGIPKIEIRFNFPGELDLPYQTMYGLVKLADLALLYAEHGKGLIAANIRAYKGDTQVNEGILATLRDKPEVFVYYNNGLTAYCKRLSVFNADRARVEYKRVAAYDFSIVNGAQTLGAINSRSIEIPGNSPEGYVFIKLISLERCENDLEFAQEITRTANYQNRIDPQHFIAQQPYQEEIARNLLISDIYYHYKDDADVPTSDEYNFTLKDATTALACLAQIQDCDLIARVVTHRPSLWSLDVDYPDDPLYKTRYAQVFKEDRAARTVWRAVQTQSIVIEQMKQNTRAESGVRKTFFENARWLILNIIFLRLRPEQGNDMTIGPADVENIRTATLEYSEILWSACETLGYVSRQTDGRGGYDSPRHLKSIFGSAADCVRLRSKMLEQLNQT